MTMQTHVAYAGVTLACTPRECTMNAMGAMALRAWVRGQKLMRDRES